MQYSNQIETVNNQADCMITGPVILYHELDGSGTIIRSIALDSAMIELLSVALALIVFFGIVRWIIGGDDQ